MKNMKNFFIRKNITFPALTALMAAIILTGCDLNEYPQDTASRLAIFGSASGLELYSNSFYELLPTPYDGVFQVDDNSDLVARNGVDTRLSVGSLSPVTSSGWSWTDLRNINYFIENCEASSVAEKNNYLGIARFFRAWFYFEKVKRFGDVPWIDRPIDVNDKDKLYAGRDDRFKVMENVLADLDYAIENISASSDPSSTHITKNAARAYKTRVCLYEASFRKYHTRYGKQSTADKWYEEVIKTADAITGYSLHQGANAYRQMFLQKTPYADETILAVALNSAYQTYSSRNRKTISPTYGNRPALTRRFINTYLNIDGTPFTSDPKYKTMPFTEEVKKRDPRLSQTVRTGDYKRTENGVPVPAPPNLDQTYTGYQIIKGCYDERFPYDDESRNENAHLIFRYAEILLNKAEALAELNRMTDNDWAATIGALRSRAGIEGNLNTRPTTADPYMVDFYRNKFSDPVLLEVLRERAIEMITEGLRPDDLIRWHIAELLAEAPMNGMFVPALGDYDLNEDGIVDVCFYQGEKPASAATVFVDVTSPGVGKRHLSENTSGEIIWNPGAREWLEKKYLYPIPEADKIKNPNLGQNSGWE
jgi:hypothetical protein